MRRRLAPLLILALLAVPASASAAAPKPRALASDAAATKALVSAARKIETCRSKTIDYSRCDSPLPVARGVLVVAGTEFTYELAARSKQGRRFFLERATGGRLLATCTPAGRGACGKAGTWKPKPRPVMTPALGHEWLAHEREFVVRLDGVVVALDRCRAARGTFEGCESDPDTLAATAWPGFFTRVEIYLTPDTSFVGAHAASGTEFQHNGNADGSIERLCLKRSAALVSPCVDGRW